MSTAASGRYNLVASGGVKSSPEVLMFRLAERVYFYLLLSVAAFAGMLTVVPVFMMFMGISLILFCL